MNMRKTGELGIAFLLCTLFAVAAAASLTTTVAGTVPTTTLSVEELDTVVSATTGKFDEGNKITTFVPSLSASKPVVTSTKKVGKYQGDQVLRVFTVNSKHRKKIKEIERDNSE